MPVTTPTRRGKSFLFRPSASRDAQPLSIAVKNGVARACDSQMRDGAIHCLEPLRKLCVIFSRTLDAPKHYEDAEVRCVVIESEGPVFSAGHDLADFRDAAPSTSRRILETCAEVSCLLQSIPQVTVAAVGGAAFAGGAQLAASCDIVLAHSDRASFQLTGVHGRGSPHTAGELWRPIGSAQGV